jgi:META domain-containing protein
VIRPLVMLRLLLLTLMAVAGCAGAGTALTAGRATPEPPADPMSLPGWWRVEGTDQVVLVDPVAIEVVRDGSTVTGTWLADPAGRLVVQIALGTGVPVGPAGLGPDWLADVAGYRVEGPDRVLLDSSGAAKVRLMPAPSTPGSGRVDPGRPVTEADRHRSGPAAPVAAPARPAEPGELVGRWVPEGATAPAYVELAADGAWAGSDGCNRTGGRWLAGPDGAFLAAAAPVRTLIACDGGADVGDQLAAARRAALDGSVLVLQDVDGAVVGRFRRG